MQIFEINSKTYIFPESVWEPTLNGWASRPRTPEDTKRREALAEELNAAGERVRERNLQQG